MPTDLGERGTISSGRKIAADDLGQATHPSNAATTEQKA